MLCSVDVAGFKLYAKIHSLGVMAEHMSVLEIFRSLKRRFFLNRLAIRHQLVKSGIIGKLFKDVKEVGRCVNRGAGEISSRTSIVINSSVGHIAESVKDHTGDNVPFFIVKLESCA